MDGGAVVIRGPPRNGPPAERILALTNINAPRLARRKTANADATEDEAFAWDAREYLRKMIVGKPVLGNVVHNPGNRYGTKNSILALSLDSQIDIYMLPS